jgi:hypothetical protein
MRYPAVAMHCRRIQRWGAVVILAIMALLTLEGLGVFEAGHDDCADHHGHEACVCVCACHAFSIPAAGIEIAPPAVTCRIFPAPPMAAGVSVPVDIFRPPLA